jgi:hypothetical protein
MRKLKQRRPEVEALEAVLLLSGMAGVHGTAAAPNPLHLTGALHGTFKSRAGGGSFKGTGSLSPIGHVTVTGSATTGTEAGNTGALKLSNKQGQTLVSLSGTSTGATSFSGTYTVAGGTKAYAGETGSGSVTLTLSGKKFSATFS